MPRDPLLDLAQALGSETRLNLLRQLGAEGLSVADAAASMGIAQSTTSYHLAKLVSAGLAVPRRSGQQRIYAWPANKLVEIVLRDAKPV